MLIARLIADKADLETRVEQMNHAMRVVGAASGALAPPETQFIGENGEVLELTFHDCEPRDAVDVVDRHFAGCDALFAEQPIEIPRLFVSDMDSTMIGQECIDELADFAGLKDQISDITERAMQGELDFESALRERVGLLAGLEEGAIDRCLAERIAPTPGAEVLTRTLKALGARCVLVTGGFHHFADPVSQWLGFDRVVGNRLAVADGKLTGHLDGPISDAGTKLAVLREERAKLGASAHVLASGDGANDVPMIEAATYGFAYRAKPKARAAANGRIDGEDLTAILLLLGIPRSDWVTG